MAENPFIIDPDAGILVTGAAGFIGSKVVEKLLAQGFRNLRCLVRPSSNTAKIEALVCRSDTGGAVKILRGNLLAPLDCAAAVKDVAVVYHLAAGTGEKSFPDAFMNSVVTTRNLLDASLQSGALKRFVSISSFAVYSNRNKATGRVLDETCPVEEKPELRCEAYCYAKLKQDQLVEDYARRHQLPYVILRPGVVYGPGKDALSGRIGRNLGVYLHLGGSNPVPLSYVDNCADAIVLAGLIPQVSGEVFNVVDDDLPSSRNFLRSYKREVRSFRSIYLPKPLSYLLCVLWEKYSTWSHGQLPPILNRLAWHAYWKGSLYTNAKLKSRLGWRQNVTTAEGMRRFFVSCRPEVRHA